MIFAEVEIIAKVLYPEYSVRHDFCSVCYCKLEEERLHRDAALPRLQIIRLSLHRLRSVARLIYYINQSHC